MFRKVLDFILLSLGITPKGGGEPAEDKWVEIRRRKEAERQAEGDAAALGMSDAGDGDGDD